MISKLQKTGTPIFSCGYSFAVKGPAFCPKMMYGEHIVMSQYNKNRNFYVVHYNLSGLSLSLQFYCAVSLQVTYFEGVNCVT